MTWPRAARVVAFAVAGVAALLLLLVGLLETPWGVRVAAETTLRTLDLWPGTTAHIGGARGGFLTGIELHDAVLMHRDGTARVRVDTLRLVYRLNEVLARPLVLREARLAGLTIVARDLPPPGPKQPKSVPFEARFGRVELTRGALSCPLPVAHDSSLELSEVALRADSIRIGRIQSFTLDTLSGVAVWPGGAGAGDAPLRVQVDARGALEAERVDIATLALATPASRIVLRGAAPLPRAGKPWTDGVDLRLDAEPVGRGDVRRVVPALRQMSNLTLAGTARGDSTALDVMLTARTRTGGAADLGARLTPPGRGAAGFAARVRVNRFDLADLLGGTRGTHVIDASLDADLEGPSHPHWSGPFVLWLADSAAGAPARVRLNLDARFADGRATLALAARAAGVALDAGGTASPFERAPVADLTGDITVPPVRLGAPGDSSRPVLYRGRADWTLLTRGVKPDSAQGRLHVTLAPEPGATAVLEHGDAELGWQAGRVTARTDLGAAGGTVSLRGGVTLGKELSYRIDQLSLRGLDPAAFLGDSAHGRLSADLELDGRGFDPATMRLDGRITGLDLTRGGLAIDSTRVTVGIARGAASVETHTVLDGGAVGVRATFARLGGRPQRLEVRIDPARLDVGRLTGGVAGERMLDGSLRFEARADDLIEVARDLTRRRGTRGDSASVAAAAAARHALEALSATIDVSLRPSRLRLTTLERGVLHAELAHGAARFHGEAATAAGGLAWRGHARPFDTEPRLDLEQLELRALDLGPLLGQREFSTKLVGTMTGSLTGASPESLRAEALVNLDHSRINQLTFDRLGVAGKWGNGEFAGDLEARSSDGHADLTLRGKPLADSIEISGQGALDFPRLGALVDRDSLEGAAIANVSLAGMWPRSGNLAHADLVLGLDGRAHLDRARIDTVRVAAKLADATLDVAALELQSNVLTLNGAGAIPFRGAPPNQAGDFRLDARFIDLAPLARVLRVRMLAGGTGHLMAKLSGPAERAKARLELVANHTRGDKYYVDSLAVTADAELRDLAIMNAKGHAFAGSLISPMVAARDLDASFTLDTSEVFVDLKSARAGLPGIEVAARAWPRAHRARLERLEIPRFTPPLQLASPVEIQWANGLAFSELLLKQGEARRISASASFDSAGTIRAAARIDSLELEPLTDLAGYPRYGGHVSGQLDLSGTRAAPRLDGSLRLTINVDRKPLVAVENRVHWAESVIDAHTLFALTKGGTLALEARVPLETRDSSGVTRLRVGQGTWHGRVAAEHFDFANLQPLVSRREVSGIRGILDGEVKLEGTREAAEFSGALALDGAVVELPALGTKLHEGTVHLAFSGREMRFERFGVRSGPGRLDVTGRVTFADLLAPVMDLHAKPNRFQVMNSLAGKLETSGDLALTGTAAAPAAAGKIEITNSTFWLEGAATGHKYEAVQLTEEDLHELRTHFESGGEVRMPGPEPLSPARLDVAVHLGHGVWVRRRSDPVLALELNGDVRVHKEPAEPLRIAGTVGVIAGRSYISFLGHRFDVTSANVGLPGEVEKASAQVEAQYDPSSSRQSDAADVQVSAFVSISATGTTVDLRSTPYLSRDAIMTFIATGQLPGQVGGQSESGTASQLAFGYVLGAVGSAAGQRVGFDVVQVTQEAYGGNVLSAGTYVNPKLYLGFRQPVNQQQSTARGPGNEIQSTEYDVEFEALRRMLVNVQGNDTQTRIFMRPRLGR